MDNISVDNISVDNEIITISGRNWSSRDAHTFTVSADLQNSLYDLLRIGILESLKRYNVDIKEGYEDKAVDHVMNFVQCKLNGRGVPREEWKVTIPQKGDFLEFLVAPQGGGGGGGKMILSAVLSIALIAVAFVAVAATAAAIAGSTFGSAMSATVGGTLSSLAAAGGGTLGAWGAAASLGVGMAVMMAGSMAINALTPTPKMKGMSDSQANTSPTYSIGSSSNRTNALGYVPLVLGKFRYHAPLGAKTFSRWINNKQYFYLLPIWGHCDIELYDMRVGDTQLIDYGTKTTRTEVTTENKKVSVDLYGDINDPVISHHLIANNLSNLDNDNFHYFGEVFNEQSVGAVLKNKNGWVQRTIGDCDAIKVDLSFSMLAAADKKSGATSEAEVQFNMQYRDLADPNGTWLPFEEPSNYRGRIYEAIDKRCAAGTKVYAWLTDNGEYHACSDGDIIEIKRYSKYYNKKTYDLIDMVTYYTHGTVERDVYDDDGYYSYTTSTASVGRKTDWVVAWVNDPDNSSSPMSECVQFSDSSDNTFSINPTGGSLHTVVTETYYDEDAYGGEGGSVYGPRRITEVYPVLHAPSVKVIKNPSSGLLRVKYDKMSGYNVSIFTAIEKNEALDKHNFAVRVMRKTQDRSEDDGYENDTYKFYDEATWSVVAGVIHKKAVQIPVGVRTSEFKIMASENFSGSVNVINAVGVSSIPIMIEGLNGTYGGWTDLTEYNPATWGRTRNPADLLHYVLTNKHAIFEPFTPDRIDEESFYKFWHYCNNNDYKFDLVCDSERNSWELWSAIASAGRGTLTVDRDGKFAVVIDGGDVIRNSDGSYTLPPPVQMFTPLNSWDFSIDRNFFKSPHALRVSYKKDPEADLSLSERKTIINKQKNHPENIIVYADGHAEVSSIFEADSFEEREDFIYGDYYDESTDSWKTYNRDNATDIVDWSFTGKTRFPDLWKMGRYYLAAMRLRPYTATLTTDWEWLMCHRGDVVVVAHDVLMNTFGVARITALVYIGSDGSIYYRTTDDVDDPYDAVWVSNTVNCKFSITKQIENNTVVITYTLMGVQIDDTVIFSEENVNYSITFRDYNGKVSSYRLDRTKHPYNSSSNVLWLERSIPNNTSSKTYVRPYIGGLVSIATTETQEARYIVASITPSESNTAELSLIPYNIEGILDSVYGPVPDVEYKVVDASVGSLKSLPTPTIGDIISDERVMQIDTKSNDVVYRMQIVVNKPALKVSTNLSNVIMQIHITDVGTKEVRTQLIPYNGNTTEVIFAGVKEAQAYLVKARMTCDEGVTSEWSPIVRHKVVGGTTLPPKATSVALKSSQLYIKLANAPLDIAGFNVYTGPNEEKLSQIGYFSANLDLTAISKNNTTLCTCYADIKAYMSEYKTFFIETVDRGGRKSKEHFKIDTGKLTVKGKPAVKVSSVSATSAASTIAGNVYRGTKADGTLRPVSASQISILGA